MKELKRGIDLEFEIYKKLVKIRVLLDESPAKAKQLLTDLIQKFEKERKLI